MEREWRLLIWQAKAAHWKQTLAKYCKTYAWTDPLEGLIRAPYGTYQSAPVYLTYTSFKPSPGREVALALVYPPRYNFQIDGGRVRSSSQSLHL